MCEELFGNNAPLPLMVLELRNLRVHFSSALNDHLLLRAPQALQGLTCMELAFHRKEILFRHDEVLQIGHAFQEEQERAGRAE